VIRTRREGSLELAHPTTGKSLVVLEQPDAGRKEPPGLTPDGTRLVCTSHDDLVAYTWDLRELRKQLAEFGLDWDATPFAPAPPSPPLGRYAIPRLTAKVIGADLATNAQARLRHVQAEAVFKLWLNPFDADANYRLGSSLVNTNPKAAVVHLTFALVGRPGHEGALSTRALLALRQRWYADAAADADQALASGSGDPQTRFIRASALVKLNRHADAFADLNAVLVIYPQDWEALELRAECHRAMGSTDAAKTDGAAATAAIAQARPLSLNNRAWQLVTDPSSGHDPARALVLIDEAIRRQPATATFWNTRGVVLYRLGQYAEAVADLQKSLEASKGESDAFDLFFLAMCHVRLGEAGKAKDCFDRAVKWFEARKKSLAATDVEELKAFQAEAEAELRAP
jgi:tetratricopeptide (TPR) repeat protein